MYTIYYGGFKHGKTTTKLTDGCSPTGADLIEILQAIIDAAEYEDDYVKVDPEAINIARNYLHEFRSPLLMGDDSDTLH